MTKCENQGSTIYYQQKVNGVVFLCRWLERQTSVVCMRESFSRITHYVYTHWFIKMTAKVAFCQSLFHFTSGCLLAGCFLFLEKNTTVISKEWKVRTFFGCSGPEVEALSILTKKGNSKAILRLLEQLLHWLQRSY